MSPECRRMESSRVIHDQVWPIGCKPGVSPESSGGHLQPAGGLTGGPEPVRLRGRRLCISDTFPGEVEAAGLGTLILEPLALSRRGERCRGDKVCLTRKTTEALSESSGTSGGVCLGALPRRAVRPQSSDGIWGGRWRAFFLCPSPRAPATGSLGILGLGGGWCYWEVLH